MIAQGAPCSDIRALSEDKPTTRLLLDASEPVCSGQICTSVTLFMTAAQRTEAGDEHPDKADADHDFAQRMMPIARRGKQQH